MGIYLPDLVQKNHSCIRGAVLLVFPHTFIRFPAAILNGRKHPCIRPLSLRYRTLLLSVGGLWLNVGSAPAMYMRNFPADFPVRNLEIITNLPHLINMAEPLQAEVRAPNGKLSSVVDSDIRTTAILTIMIRHLEM